MPERKTLDLESLVARYLLEHGYEETLFSFQQEANYTLQVAQLDNPWSLDSLVQEHNDRELALETHRLQINSIKVSEPWKDFGIVDLSNTSELTYLVKAFEHTIDIGANVLEVKVCTEVRLDAIKRTLLLVSDASRRVQLYDIFGDSVTLVGSLSTSSPVLCSQFIHFQDRCYLVLGHMDSSVVLREVSIHDGTATFGDTIPLPSHSKYVVKAIVNEGRSIIATVGYDKQIRLIRYSHTEEGGIELTELQPISLLNTPESACFGTESPDKSAVTLLVGARDSPFVEYYEVEEGGNNRLDSQQNMNELKDLHVSFCAMDLEMRPCEPLMLAVATSKSPTGRTLFMPPYTDKVTHESWNEAPQDQFSRPLVRWRPCGTGVWVNGDDGVIRGIHVGTGKVMTRIKAHEGVTRSMWAGLVDGKEYLVSGGFDRKLRIWHT